MKYFFIIRENVPILFLLLLHIAHKDFKDSYSTESRVPFAFSFDEKPEIILDVFFFYIYSLCGGHLFLLRFSHNPYL